MGKGDKRTRRGKLFAGSFGNTRPHKVKKKTATATTTTAKPKAKKSTKKAIKKTKAKK